MLKVIREGIGTGALKQYERLRRHWNPQTVEHPTFLYFNAFTRDRPRLERFKSDGGRIISRVGGWHFESAETTAWVLARSDAAIFVSGYTQELARKYFDKLPDRQCVIVNSTDAIKPTPLHDPPYLLVRAGGIGYPVWRKTMLERSLSVFALYAIWDALSVFALYAIWDDLRAKYPNLELRIIGRVNREIKKRIPEEKGIRYVDYIGDAGKLREYGARAIALVHLVIGDHSPNTVCEIVGEGRPAIVLDRGGAREVAGQAGIVVPTGPSKHCTDLDSWWALDGRTYRPDLNALFNAVGTALEDANKWQDRARQRAKEITSHKTADQYMQFIKGPK